MAAVVVGEHVIACVPSGGPEDSCPQCPALPLLLINKHLALQQQQQQQHVGGSAMHHQHSLRPRFLRSAAAQQQRSKSRPRPRPRPNAPGARRRAGMRSISWASRAREFSPPAPKEKDKDVGGGRRKASGWADRALIRTWVRRRPQYAVDERGGTFLLQEASVPGAAHGRGKRFEGRSWDDLGPGRRLLRRTLADGNSFHCTNPTVRIVDCEMLAASAQAQARARPQR